MSEPTTPPIAHTRLVARPIPDNRPPVISADEAYAHNRSAVAPFVQDALALDFFPPEPEFDRAPTPASSLPDPERTVAALASSIIEVLSGERPAPQLIRHTTPPVYTALARRALVATRRGLASKGRRGATTRRVQLCEPAEGVIEAAAVVVAGARVRAVALRLEGLDGRWMITRMAVG